MYIEDVLLKIITDDEKIQNHEVKDNIEPNEASYDNKSCFVVYSYSEKPIRNTGTARNGLFTLYIFADTKAGAKELDHITQKILDDYKGVEADLNIKSICYQGSEDGYDRKVKKFFYVATYKVKYTEKQRGYA